MQGAARGEIREGRGDDDDGRMWPYACTQRATGLGLVTAVSARAALGVAAAVGRVWVGSWQAGGSPPPSNLTNPSPTPPHRIHTSTPTHNTGLFRAAAPAARRQMSVWAPLVNKPYEASAGG